MINIRNQLVLATTRRVRISITGSDLLHQEKKLVQNHQLRINIINKILHTINRILQAIDIPPSV